MFEIHDNLSVKEKFLNFEENPVLILCYADGSMNGRCVDMPRHWRSTSLSDTLFVRVFTTQNQDGEDAKGAWHGGACEKGTKAL